MSSSPFQASGPDHSPLHFNLGVDLLASGGEIQSLPHDWEAHDQNPRKHGDEEWQPSDSGQMQIWAARLDVPGF